MTAMGRDFRGTVAVALGLAAMVTAGCGAVRPSAAPAVSVTRTVPSGVAAGPQHRALAARYLGIAKAGNRRLDAEFGRLNGRDRTHLAAAEADLRNAAATERTFDRRLLLIAFPPAIETFARALFWVNQDRASLTEAAAASPSLRELHHAQRGLAEANRPVEQFVRLIRSRLGLPPPSSS
jgi:hypothetical protein